MHVVRLHTLQIACCAALAAASAQAGLAATLCVNHAGSGGCYSSIQKAVSHAAANDVIDVGPGTYKEDITIGIPLSLLGAGAEKSTIDATGLPNGIFVDGYDNPSLGHVIVDGFTVKNAQFEGVLVVSASDVTVRNNTIVDNDKFGPVFSPNPSGCLGQPAFETDESGDCGGGLHFIGVSGSVVSGNTLTGNADGILLSDETAETHDNLLIHNIVKDNALECGVVLASHNPVGSTGPFFAPHFGVDHNTIEGNLVADNGVKVGGAGVGLFSDGNGPGGAYNNVISHNVLTGNGIGGVSLHTHVGPSFGAPADNMNGNTIVGNYIAGNLADGDDTATPGRVGININSGGGGTPIWNTVIGENIIRDEDVDIAINTPGTVNMHLNDLLGGKIGVANICAFDHASCTGSIDATQNYWGCSGNPHANGCSTTSGASILSTPALTSPATDEGDGHGDHH